MFSCSAAPPVPLAKPCHPPYRGTASRPPLAPLGHVIVARGRACADGGDWEESFVRATKTAPVLGAPGFTAKLGVRAHPDLRLPHFMCCRRMALYRVFE